MAGKDLLAQNRKGMTIHDYIIDHEGFDWQKLLENWLWLLPERFVVWIMNRFGDLFIVLEDGTVQMLDVGAGTLTQIAESREDFAGKLDEAETAAVWLMTELTDRLVASGLILADGECYGFRIPPALGGAYLAENVAVLPVDDYLGAYGSIHEQMKDVPDGGQVVIKTTNREIID
jgi:hypothetical protein